MLKKLFQLAVRTKKQIPFAVSALALCCSLSTPAQAIPYNQISQVYFFGDSLTDSGFNDMFPRSAGKAPTFTTYGGYTWAQYVARDIKGFVLPVYPGPNPADTLTNNAILPQLSPPASTYVSGNLTGFNYACAGATTNSTGYGETWAPSLTQQVNYYLSTKAVDPSAIYFLFAGANDLLKLLPSAPGQPIPSQAQLLATANIAALNIGNSVAQLAASGAKRIIVLSLPNIGITPYASALAAAGGGPALPGSLKTVTFTFNSMLNSQLGAVINKYGTKILYVDTYDLIDNVFIATQAGQPYVAASGQAFQFVNATGVACSTVQQSINCPSTAPNGYLFADSIHPTDMAHRVLSLLVESQILSWQ